MKKAQRTKKPKPSPKKSGEIAVSYSALSETEQSLKHSITSLGLELRSVETRLTAKQNALEEKIDAVEARLNAKIDAVEARLNAKIDAVEARLNAKIDAVEAKLDAKITKLDSKLELVLAAVHRVAALVEEQNSRNRYVLDGYASLYDAQEDIKARLEKLEKKGV